MCGFFAWWPQKSDPKNKILAMKALEALKPRGPDESYLYCKTNTDDNDSVLLGHCRLKITGDSGKQPLWSEDGSIGALVNGQFYDYKKYKKELIDKGYKFKTQTDSEILIGLYQEYGFDCIKFLEGEFVFVLWDSNKKLVWASKDRAGCKPLRFSLRDGLAFSSESKGFFAANWPARWNKIALAQALSVQYPHPRLTLFEDIYQLAPGESVIFQDKSIDNTASDALIHSTIFTPNTYNRVIDQGDINKSKWSISSYNWFRWFPHKEEDLERLSNEEADWRLEKHLNNSVKRRVEDNAWSSAVHLSGGCDSSSILTLATKHAISDLHAYCVEFEDDDSKDIKHNESSIAKDTAHKLGVDFSCVKASRIDIVTHWSQAIERAESLGINGHIVAKWLLSRQINADGHRISLSGEGADEALLGYPFLAMERLGGDEDKESIESIKKSNLVSIGSMIPDDEQIDLDKHLNSTWSSIPIWARAKASIGFKLQSLMRDEWINEITPKALSMWDNPTVCMSIQGQHKLHHASSTWANLALGGYMLPALADAPETGFQIQGRTPFLDGDLLDEVMRWDVRNTYYDGTAKAPLRSYLRKQKLDNVANTPKHPFEAPPILGDATAVDYIKEQWSDPRVWVNTPFDFNKIKEFMRKWDSFDCTQRQRYEPVIATLLSIQHLSSLFIDEK